MRQSHVVIAFVSVTATSALTIPLLSPIAGFIHESILEHIQASIHDFTY
ncbi:hypothetical protein CCHL11_02567 [Colletotrichum chlorophyti]|uniref:Uncharacterized protein n=1 Tax=Colletotrichum chlorophyti TaxID=708187 RepID=A0A1Q8S911_9PEZI|nr:hypothetical protein CCHL11_02567 [Colletotrichum chlorophyti]